MILPVLQSVLTLVLVVSALDFLFRRLRRFALLVNTGTRGDEDLNDRPRCECDPFPADFTRGGWTSTGEWIPAPHVDERAAEGLPAEQRGH